MIISAFTSPNKIYFEPKLYLQKSIFQRNKQCSKILSNEEVMVNLLKIAPRIKTTASVDTCSKKYRHFKSVAEHIKKCRYLRATTIYFKHCKGSNIALNDLQPPPTTRTNLRPLNISLQQHLEGEQ